MRLLSVLVLLFTGVAASPAAAAPAPMSVWGAAPQGFGAAATGGAGGPVAWVTTVADAGPGSLRAAAMLPGPRRIQFLVSGTIRLAHDIEIGENVTVDGRGADITITGRGLSLRWSNVVLRNLKFTSSNPSDIEQDAVRIDGATRVWIDHVTFSDAGDKAIDMVRGTDVTISWSHFHHQEQVIQLGTYSTATASRAMRVTLHHNFFDRTGYRNPLITYGVVHAYNNYLLDWGTFGMSATRGAQLLSEHNVYEAGRNRRGITSIGGKADKDRSYGSTRSVGDLLLAGTRLELHDSHRSLPFPPKALNRQAASLQLRQEVQQGAGWQSTGPLLNL